MRALLFFLLFSFLSNLSFTQIWEKTLLNQNKDATISDKTDAFNKYRLGRPYVKGNGYKPYARSLHFLEK